MTAREDLRASLRKVLGERWLREHGGGREGQAASHHHSGSRVGPPQHGRASLQPSDLTQVFVAVDPAAENRHVRRGPGG